mgnify:CR=1 FL=1
MVGLWSAVQGAHVALRFVALSQLRFATLNQKRACALAAAHVAAVAAPRLVGDDGSGGGGGSFASSSSGSHGSSSNGRISSSNSSGGGGGGGGGASSSEEELVEGRGAAVPLPGVEAVNAAEPMLAPAATVRPRLRAGVTLQEAWGGPPPAGGALEAWAGLYAREQYMLAWRGGAAWVAVKQGAAPLELLQAVWQAAWLDAAAGGGGAGPEAGEGEGVGDMALLQESLEAARVHYPGFLESMRAAGWDLDAPPVLQMQQTRIVVEGDA